MRFDVDPQAHTLAGDGGPRRIPSVTGEAGLVVEVARDGFAGVVVHCTPHEVVVRDRRGRERRFSNVPGAFYVEDQRVQLLAPADPLPPKQPPPTTASGAVISRHAPRIARASRILVEGIHDAELLERIWGDELRYEGIVVEPLHGADDLGEAIARFGPGPARRLGVLLDHLVAGSKETRLAAGVNSEHVLITGHRFVDVWQAVHPQRVGLKAWPTIPPPRSWKEGAAQTLGFTEVPEAWRHILGSVRSWHDLDRSLIGAVERLIDFVRLAEEP